MVETKRRRIALQSKQQASWAPPAVTDHVERRVDAWAFRTTTLHMHMTSAHTLREVSESDAVSRSDWLHSIALAVAFATLPRYPKASRVHARSLQQLT
jgi:hypothetical protein